MNFPFVDIAKIQLERETGQLLKEVISERIEGLCIGKISDNQITIAVADPQRIEIYNIVEVSSEGRFKPTLVQADPQLLTLARDWTYRVTEARHHETWLEWLPSKRFESERLATPLDSGNDDISGQAVDRAEQLLKEAIAVGASDIHLETYKNEFLVKYRQDGVLRLIDRLTDTRLAGSVVKRLKVLAHMDVTQSRQPQGGRISVSIAEESYEFRVSLVPVKHGESMVLRLLHSGALDLELTDLGFNEHQMKAFRQMIHRPHGMVLVTGPTGSGKTTTLYASLKDIMRPDRKILTVEDPVEYEVPGIVQVQVETAASDPEKRVTFARILREFMRQDPDVILVGEIRDSETAEISVKASLTGHLLLSTLHTNDAIGIISRLRDQDVKPFLLASTLAGGLAQRLVRKVCKNCQEPYNLTEEEKELFSRAGVSMNNAQFVKGRGCELCRRTGYAGRIALFEVLNVSRKLKHLIESEATQEELAETALAEGMKTLLQDGLEKACRGLVSMEEVQRVCATDHLN